jgi:hypothetical protein
MGERVLGEYGPPLGGFFCLPLMVDRDVKTEETGDGLVPFLAGLLRAMVGVEKLSSALAEALLRSGRVIVDGLSERDEVTQRAFDAGQPNFSIMRLIATSRNLTHKNIGILLQTQQIPSDALYSFIDRYIGSMVEESGASRPAEAEIHEACAQLKRLLGETPTTPLFASLWAEEIGRSGFGVSARIKNVAELMDAYVARLLAPAGRTPLRPRGCVWTWRRSRSESSGKALLRDG